MNKETTDQDSLQSTKDPLAETTTNNEMKISDPEYSKLTYRQKFALTEYKYLLSPEDAEQVGKMLGNLVKEKDILAFCQAHEVKVSDHIAIEPIQDHKVGDLDTVTTTRRPVRFLVAYLVGVALVTLTHTYGYVQAIPAIFLFAIYYLPWGLVLLIERISEAFGSKMQLLISQGEVLVPANALAKFLILISYLLLIGIATAGSLTKNERRFRALFTAFTMLLLLGVGGCSLIH